MALRADGQEVTSKSSSEQTGPPPGPRHRSMAMPLVGEPIAPWLGAGLVAAGVTVIAVGAGQQLPIAEQSLLLIGLGAVMAAGGLVSARSNRQIRASRREERERPAQDQLAAPPDPLPPLAYVAGMERWTSAMLELLHHAVSVSELDGPDRDELTAAATDTADLNELFAAEGTRELDINDLAQLHALGSLWETSQLRLERRAALVDPAWHRRWRARTVVARQLRHGPLPGRPLVLPYR